MNRAKVNDVHTSSEVTCRNGPKRISVNWAVSKESHSMSIQRFVLRDEFMELCCLQISATSVLACRCGKNPTFFGTTGKPPCALMTSSPTSAGAFRLRRAI